MATGRVPTTANSPLTAKGDLFGYSTAPARLAVGNDGEQIVADSSTSTGLRYHAQKTQNALYNSGFDIAQRGTSFTALAAADYTLDRWVFWSTTASQSNYASQQSAGNLSVSPNQAIRYCGRFGRTSGTTNTGARQLFQTLETSDSVRLAGQTVTFSFYARAGANYSQLLSQLNFGVVTGTGTDQIYYSFTGSATAFTGVATLTTSWQRFTATGTLPTTTTEIGTYFSFSPTGTAGAADYFEVTGLQLEVGSVATPFNRQNGTIQGELAACLRYYEVCGAMYGYAFASTTIQGLIGHSPKRVTPSVGLTTSTPYGESPINVTGRTGTNSTTVGSPDPNKYGSSLIRIDGFSGMTAGTISYVQSGQITLSAEL